MIRSDVLTHLLFWGKVSGAISTLGGVIWGIANWFGKVSETNRNVSLITTNHLPHIADCLNAHSASLESLKSDVRNVSTEVQGVSTRLDDHLNSEKKRKKIK